MSIGAARSLETGVRRAEARIEQTFTRLYESLVGRELGGAALDGAQAREQLSRALVALQQQGALPVLGSRLRQTMVALDSTFNEANLGHEQFAGFLRANADLVQLEYRNKLLYVGLAAALLLNLLLFIPMGWGA